MDRGLYNLVIFLDVQKAFDTVNHVLLLGKLEACGIRDNALNLLASYLAHRKQTCQVNGKQSGLRSISCGTLRVQFWAHFSFWYKLMICQIASNTPHPECLLTIPA